MKIQLEEIFNGESKETVDFVMEELGFVPTPAQGSLILQSDSAAALSKALGCSAEALADPSGWVFTAIQADLPKARERAKKETLAYVKSIFDICALGGMEKMAPALIREETKIEDARIKVQNELANKSRRKITNSTISSVSADGSNPLVEAAKKAATDYAAKKTGNMDSLSASRSGSDGDKFLH